ncbi:Mismatch repair protein msh3, partial [Rhizopus stolonifer]
LVQVLDGFVKVSTAFHHVNNIEFKSRLLNQLFGRLPTVQSIVSEFRSAVQPTKDKVHFFLSEERWPEIPREKNNIKSIEHILQEHLAEQKTVTGLEDHLKFVTVAGIDYLFEVSNAKTKSVPQDWIKISGTKTVSRYHDKFIIQKLKEHEQHREMLALCADKAYKSFLVDIAQHYEDLRDVVSCLAQLDCLLSLSITASQTDYVKPTLVQTHEPYIDVIEARHPIIEHLTSNYVSNDIQLGHPHKTLILTGPNMGGKSSYVRQIGLIAMMAQIGSYVPAKSATLGMLDAIYTRMGASDNMMRGESTFMVELNETSDMMRHATSRSLVILDELGRGTSTHDGQAIAYAVLKYFVDLGSLALFVTHYPSLGNMSQEFPDKVKNGFMGFLEEEGQDGISDIVFLYKLVNGIASSSYGMNVAKLANIPVSVIKAAKSKSEQLQKETDQFGLKQKHID